LGFARNAVKGYVLAFPSGASSGQSEDDGVRAVTDGNREQRGNAERASGARRERLERLGEASGAVVRKSKIFGITRELRSLGRPRARVRENQPTREPPP
jgi:hypothetical protein